MSGYELRDREDGSVDLVEIVPTVIATFTDRTHAERYFGILMEAEAPRRRPEPPLAESPVSPSPVAHVPQAAPERATVAPGKTASRLISGSTSLLGHGGAQPSQMDAPRATASSVEPAEPSWSEPTDTEWQQALEAIAGGAEMKKVAAALNVNFYKLRGKYAGWCRAQKADVSSGQEELKSDQEHCRICDRAFKPTDSSDGLCARCSR